MALGVVGIVLAVHIGEQMLYTGILVNKTHMLPLNFIPKPMITMNEPMGKKVDPTYRNKLVPCAYKAFKKMQKAAFKQNGFKIFVDSSYRSAEYQKKVFYNSVKKNGLKHAQKYLAEPGASEHQTGLAIDIIFMQNDKMIEPFVGMEEEPEIKWLAANAHEYGFVLRYPKNKNGEDFNVITGFKFEPWHFRYVGKKIAKEMFAKGITLEEYYDMNHNFFDRFLFAVIRARYK